MALLDDNEIGEIPAIDFTEVDGVTYLEPSTPASGQLKLFPKNDGLLYIKDSAGTVTVLDTGTSGAPSSATYITQTPNGTLTNEQALSTLATGILKNTTTTGVLSIAAAGTDYLTPSPASSAIDVISAATATVRPLALKTTDDNTTNNLLEFLSSAGAVLGSFSAAGGATLPTAYIGASGGPVATELTVITTSASDPRGILSGQYSTDTLGSRIHLRKARGTPAAPTTIVTGDYLGRVRFSGYDGSNFLQMASIDAVSTGTIAATRVPTYLSFSVATNAAPSVLTEVAQLTITGLNSTVIGATTPAAASFTNVTITGGGYIRPNADSTSALLITKADGTTAILTVDSTNNRVTFAGHIAVGGSTPNANYALYTAKTFADIATTTVGFYATPSYTLSSNNAQTGIGLRGEVLVSQNGFNLTTAPAGGIGVQGVARALGATGTITGLTAFDGTVINQGAGTLSNGYIFLAQGATNSGGGALTSVAVFVSAAQTTATNNTYVLLGTTTIPAGSWAIYASTTNDSSLAGKLRVGSNTGPSKTLDVTGTFGVTGATDAVQATITGNATQTNTLFLLQTSGSTALMVVTGTGQTVLTTSDTGTNTVVNTLQLRHNSSGVIAANYGTGLLLAGQDSTTASVSMARFRSFWTTATDATRKARAVLSAFDTAERDCIFIEASGSAPMISVLSVTTPIVQTTAYTQTYATSSHTTANPTATSVATTAAALASYGFTQTQADAIVAAVNALIVDMANVKNNVNAIIDDQQAYGWFG